MSYVAIWLQACLHWRCAYFQTLSRNDTIFLVDWDVLYKLCGLANKWSKGFVLSGKIWWQFFGCHKACSKYIPVVRPRPNTRSHSVLFWYCLLVFLMQPLSNKSLVITIFVQFKVIKLQHFGVFHYHAIKNKKNETVQWIKLRIKGRKEETHATFFPILSSV